MQKKFLSVRKQEKIGKRTPRIRSRSEKASMRLSVQDQIKYVMGTKRLDPMKQNNALIS